MSSTKEQCFEEAATAYERASGRNLGITYQQAWVKDDSGTWARGNRHWWALVNSLNRTRRWENGEADVPGTVRELRRPDLTIRGADGRDLVVDLKFTRANGSIDGWRPGQQRAYGEINRQQGTAPGPVELNAVTCQCRERRQEREYVRVPESQLQYFMSPFDYFGRAPSPGRVPGVRLPPIRIPFPGGIPVIP